MSQKVLTVEQVNRYIKKLFDSDYILKSIFIKGEVSNCKHHSSGHVYFTLKDDYAAISCVLFKRYISDRMPVLKNGMKIIVGGNVSTYEKTGQYQLNVKDIIEDGIGNLYIEFEKLKKSLMDEGLFAEENKLAIPYYCRKIGIVTSPTGAAIRDMVNVAKRRNPTIRLQLYPALVQGEQAKYDLVKGIAYFNEQEDIDAIIIGRGGGSIEDLWAFNEEIVARAIYQSKIPIISAVGHETDFTISDFVADLRAPTPSAAAELAVKTLDEIEALLNQYTLRLQQLLEQKIGQAKNRIDMEALKLSMYHPVKIVEQKQQMLVDYETKLNLILFEKLNNHKQKLAIYKEKLKGLSPYIKLKTGYAYISDEEGNKITSVQDVRKGDRINIQVFDGQIEANVYNKGSERLNDE